MTSALLSLSATPSAPPLSDDLDAVGIKVLQSEDCSTLLQDVVRTSPDLVVIYEERPENALFSSIMAVNAAAPRPVIVFTTDPDAEKIALATRSCVHAYIVNGYSQNRLRSVIHLAQARFHHDQLLRKELSEVNQRFAERKLVDHAKGILMGARQLREEEAFRALRSTAMHTKQRIGQVSQRVIDSARYAEAVNRAGQLRMLSQRLVKLYALICAGVRQEETQELFADSLGHVESNLEILARSLSKATFGDLLDAVLAPWAQLRQALGTAPRAGRLAEVDRLAEQVLLRAEQLTANLEIAGFAAALRVINVAGRQRMLSQRVAKAALMGTLLGGASGSAARAALELATAELVDGFAYLETLPLSNAEISREVGQAAQAWAGLQAALSQAGTAAGQDSIAALSETLLASIDRLTEHLERGMQALVR
jgi:AmiR/NasT family two-component response regulator